MESNTHSSGSVTRVKKHRVLLPMTGNQKRYYKIVLEKNFQSLIAAGLQKYIPNTSNIAPLLQKICIHPFLVPGFEEHLSMNQTPEKINELLFNSTPRYNYIVRVIDKCKKDKERIAIICSRNEALDLVASALESKGLDIIIVNSKVKAAQRQDEINKFNASTDHCLLISSKLAPSFRINANKVIIHDFTASDKELLIGDYSFITAPTVDVQCLLVEHSYEQLAFEKMLGEANVTWPEEGSAPNQIEPQAQDINRLLRFGAYETFNDKSIDEVLASRSSFTDQTSPFQKASFTANTEEPQIDIDDPNFWEKVLPEGTGAYNVDQTEKQSDTRRYNTRNRK